VIKKEIEYCIIRSAIDLLCAVCAGNRDQVIDRLTGYLWDEGEAVYIKGKEEIGHL
jgi:hypothetical protein